MSDRQENLKKNFFDDCVLLPSFYQPENYDLQIRTHNSIRNTIFSQSIDKIYKIENFHLKKPGDYYQYKSLNTAEMTTVDKLVEKLRLNKDAKLIGVKEFVFERNERLKKYRVKYYQDLKKENFEAVLVPSSFYDKLLNYYYRILNKY